MSAHLGRRRFLMQALSIGAVAPFSWLAQAEDDQEVFEWTPPPVGLRWSTQRRSEFSSGKVHHTRKEFEIKVVEGDLVTFQEISTDLDDGRVLNFEETSWRMWEEKSSRVVGSESVTERPDFNPGRLVGFWPWRIGSTFRNQDNENDYTYKLEAFEDMNSGGFRGRCARIVAAGISRGFPIQATSLHAAATGILLQRYYNASWDSGYRKVVTVVAEEHLSSWSVP